jgi:hypothetical protein
MNSNDGFSWDFHGPLLFKATWETLYMVSATLVIGGFLGLALGLGLYTAREGGLLQNSRVFAVLNLSVNFVRPIPFLLLLVAIGPLTVAIVGTRIGTTAMIVPLSVARPSVSPGSSSRTWSPSIPGSSKRPARPGHPGGALSPLCSSLRRSVRSFSATPSSSSLWWTCPPWRAIWPGAGSETSPCSTATSDGTTRWSRSP